MKPKKELFKLRLILLEPLISKHPLTVAISFQAGVLEMTWVVSDFTATCPQELSVTKGQQVEVVEVCSSKPDFCLVRMPTRGTDHDASVPEGLVPLAVLKQPPAPRSSPSRRAPIDHDLGKLKTNGTLHRHGGGAGTETIQLLCTMVAISC